MRQFLAVIGILALAVAPGHARDGRENRMAAKSRAGQTARGVGARWVPRLARNDAPLAATGLIPVAIDSETGELYCVNAKCGGPAKRG